MRLEMKGGAVQLGPNQTLRVVDGEGTTVCAVDGAVWITEENQPKDIVLQPGGCYRLHPIEWNIGEAAGALAAFALDRGTVPRAVRESSALLHEFQARLRDMGVELEWA